MIRHWFSYVEIKNKWLYDTVGQSCELYKKVPKAMPLESKVSLPHGEILKVKKLIEDESFRVGRDLNGIEIGCAFGGCSVAMAKILGTLTICDPYQSIWWHNKGLERIRQEHIETQERVTFYELPSEIVLPWLLEQYGESSYDFAFVDGLHNYWQVSTELFYLSRLLKHGGCVVLDDANQPAIYRAYIDAISSREFERYNKPYIPIDTRIRYMLSKFLAQYNVYGGRRIILAPRIAILRKL